MPARRLSLGDLRAPQAVQRRLDANKADETELKSLMSADDEDDDGDAVDGDAFDAGAALGSPALRSPGKLAREPAPETSPKRGLQGRKFGYAGSVSDTVREGSFKRRCVCVFEGGHAPPSAAALRAFPGRRAPTPRPGRTPSATTHPSCTACAAPRGAASPPPRCPATPRG
jgi:hypothetical protein